VPHISYNFLLIGGSHMKSMLMAVMAVAVAVTFSAPAFAGDSPKEGGKDKKPGQAVETVYGDEKK